ncbi:MAG: HNH endonuclease [Chryseobacterium sp.]|nr:MAG: HNH endonuclease [Chryseobacterium sp.]
MVRFANLPSSFYRNKVKGFCRWCGQPTGNKTVWHKQCLFAYKIVTSPSFARKAVKQRDHGVCAICKQQFDDSDWQVDHIMPLKDSRGRLRYFLLSNMQTACTRCHQEKTNRERAGKTQISEGQEPQ